MQSEIIRYCGISKFQNVNVQLISSSIAFVTGAPATITDSNSEFVEAGFQSGNDMFIRYSPNNSKVVNITTVAAGTLTLTTGETLVSEDAGEQIYLTQIKFPADLHLKCSRWLQSYISKEGISSSIVKSESLPGGYSVTFKDDSEMMKMFNGYRSF